jgi:hypothetical protein
VKINPYQSPAVPNVKQTFRNRLVTLLDLSAIFFAGLPLVVLALPLLIGRMTNEDLSDTAVAILTVLFLVSASLWSIAAIYNLYGLCNRHRYSFIGLIVTLLSLVAWAGVFVASYTGWL